MNRNGWPTWSGIRSQYDLNDEICQSAKFYKSINSTMAQHNRNNKFHRMMLQNGMESLRISLDDDAANEFINASSALMYKRLGRKTTNDLIDGRIRLTELPDNFTKALEIEISKVSGKPFSLKSRTIEHTPKSEPKQSFINGGENHGA